jgi:acyl carrier protein
LDKTAVYEKIKELMLSNLELKDDLISPEKNLNDDLELDSLDIVELILSLSDYLGKKIDPTLFNNACTVQDLVDSVAPLWKSE